MIPKGYTHQKVDRHIFEEIMKDNKKMYAFVELQRSVTNFIEKIGDIDIQIDIQTKEKKEVS